MKLKYEFEFSFSNEREKEFYKIAAVSLAIIVAFIVVVNNL